MDDAGTKSTEPSTIIEIDPHAGDVDITLLWHMLSMTPEERLEYHDAIRRSALELRRAGRKHYGITGYDDLDLNLLRRLNDRSVEYVVIGGIAANVHGSARTTYDLDICAPLDHETCVKIIMAVGDLHPRFRSRPDLPVVTPDNPNLRGLKNLYLHTDVTPIDILGDVAGVGDFPACEQESELIELGGGTFRFLKLEALIRAKRAAGRDKDLIALPELEALLKLRRNE